MEWTTHNNQQPITTYEIYRGTRLVGTTEETTFVDNTITESGDYIYSVRMITDNCSGLFQNVTVNYNHIAIEENDATIIYIYPNPAKDFVSVSTVNSQRSTVNGQSL